MERIKGGEKVNMNKQVTDSGIKEIEKEPVVLELQGEGSKGVSSNTHVRERF